MTTRSDACVAHASSWDSGRRQLHIGVPGRDLFSRVVSHRAGQGTGGTVCTVPNSRTSTRILSLYHQPWIKNAAFPLSPPIIPVKVVLFASVAKRQVENAQLTCFHVRCAHTTLPVFPLYPGNAPHPQVTPARAPFHPVSRNSCQGRRSMAQVRREGECLPAVCRTGAVYAAVPAVLRAAHLPPLAPPWPVTWHGHAQLCHVHALRARWRRHAGLWGLLRRSFSAAAAPPRSGVCHFGFSHLRRWCPTCSPQRSEGRQHTHTRLNEAPADWVRRRSWVLPAVTAWGGCQ